MQVRMEAAWDEAAEEGLLSDPRYEAATSLRAEGQYEAAVEFFEELLKTFDLSSKPPPHLAPLFFNLGSTLVCTLETGDTGDETRVAALKSAEKCLPTDNSSASISNNSSTIGSSSSIAPSVTTGTDSLSEPPLKRLKADGAEVSSATCAQQESTENADESGDDSNEESDEDDEAESEDDVQVAWQYLDQARSCYRDVLNVENSGNSSTSEGSTASSDCAAVPLSKNLHDRLTRALTRTISRLGDLNLLTQSYADALVEFEQVISLREGLRDSSIDGVCRLVDAYTQVALVYCEHLSQNGEVDLVVDTADSGRYVVAARQDFASQILAYRDQARTAMKNLVAQLARDRADLSTKDKEEICVQYQLLEDIDNRITTLRIDQESRGVEQLSK